MAFLAHASEVLIPVIADQHATAATKLRLPL